jgi:hypothetical protein
VRLPYFPAQQAVEDLHHVFFPLSRRNNGVAVECGIHTTPAWRRRTPPPANLKVHAGEVVNKEKRKMAGVHLLTELGDRFAGGLRI